MIQKLWSSLSVCFSMYSVLPMGKKDFGQVSMRYVLCFLPLVGLLMGGLSGLWYWVAQRCELNGIFYAAVATLIPVAVSGGIHLDGLLDCCDAIASYGDREKRLAILKDPHAGAFAVIYGGAYFILTLGLYAQLFENARDWAVLLPIFALSRALGALLTIHGRSAKPSGLKVTFGEGAGKRGTTATLLLWVTVLLLLTADISLWLCLGFVMVSALFCVGFYRSACRVFGGVTGDLIGMFISLTELLLLLCCVVGGLLP